MVENSHQMNSKSYAKTQGLRGSYPLHIIHNKMGLRKEIIEWSWKQQGPCFKNEDIPMHLWEEASRTGVYVQNCTPHRVLKNKTPKEVLSSKKSEINHLRIFGCPVYIHIPKGKRKKLDLSRKKGIFVGYSEILKPLQNILPRIQEDQHQ